MNRLRFVRRRVVIDWFYRSSEFLLIYRIAVDRYIVCVAFTVAGVEEQFFADSCGDSYLILRLRGIEELTVGISVS